MTLRQLRIFAAAARRLNLRAAAAELGVAQPSVSQQLTLLEEEFGKTLYRKARSGIRLTTEGALLAKEVNVILSRIDSLWEKFGQNNTERENDFLTVGGSNSPSTALLPSLLARFEKRRLRVQINLRTDTSAAVERMVVNGSVDLALITNPPANRQLQMEPYRNEPLVAFVASDHTLAKRNQLDPKDLTRVGLIIRGHQERRGASQEYVQYLRKSGFNLKVVMRCDTPVAVLEAVRQKLGVGILYRDVVADNIRRGEFRMIKMPGEAFEGRSFIICDLPGTNWSMSYVRIWVWKEGGRSWQRGDTLQRRSSSICERLRLSGLKGQASNKQPGR